MNKTDAVHMNKVLIVYGLYRAIATRGKTSLSFKTKPIRIHHTHINTGNYKVLDLKTGKVIKKARMINRTMIKGDLLTLNYTINLYDCGEERHGFTM